MERKLIDLGKAALFLGLTEEEIRQKVAQKEITAYNIGGTFLRFDLEQLEEIKKKLTQQREIMGDKQPLKTTTVIDTHSFESSKRDSDSLVVQAQNPRHKSLASPAIGPHQKEAISRKDKFLDFFHFNDFYIISFLLSLLILWIIFMTNQ